MSKFDHPALSKWQLAPAKCWFSGGQNLSWRALCSGSHKALNVVAASVRCNDVLGHCLLLLRVVNLHLRLIPTHQSFSSYSLEAMYGIDEGPLLLLVTFHCLRIVFSLERKMVKFKDASLALLKSWPRLQLFLTLSSLPCLRHKSGLCTGSAHVFWSQRNHATTASITCSK